MNSDLYKKAGVDIDAGRDVVGRVSRLADSTFRNGVMGSIGSFGGMFDLSSLNLHHPVLVSGTDGVGTKLKVAFDMDRTDSIGIDAVAMCVNDVVAQGAEPLFFLDYIAAGKIKPDRVESVVSGIAEGCRLAGCALIGGETSEMPGMYVGDEYDIVGFSCGAVERDRLIDGSKVRVGDLLIGIASSGLHSNGFSLVRKIVRDNKWDLHAPLDVLSKDVSLGDLLLTPTRIYVKSVLDVLSKCDVHGICHVTGGGFYENVPRALNKGLGADINLGSWPVPAVFSILERYGSVSRDEMFSVFNMGIGMVLVVDGSVADRVVSILNDHGESAYVIGSVTDSEGVSII